MDISDSKTPEGRLVVGLRFAIDVGGPSNSRHAAILRVMYLRPTSRLPLTQYAQAQTLKTRRRVNKVGIRFYAPGYTLRVGETETDICWNGGARHATIRQDERSSPRRSVIQS